MEWVETTAKTVEEAQELALDKLGVDELEAEFEVLEEPKQGLFGRVRGQARVRARVQPKSPRAKEDRKRRRPAKKRSESGSSKAPVQDAAGSEEAPDSTEEAAKPTRQRATSTPRSGKKADSGDAPAKKAPAKARTRKPEQKSEESSMEEVSSCVEEFLTGLTAAFGLEAPVTIDTSDDEINAKIEGKHGLLLGPKARTLDAIQELTRVAAQRSAPSSIRIKVDVGGYREQRRASLEAFAATAAARAIDEGTEVVLEPMSSADRKIVHDSLSEFEGVSTRSAGNDPRRHVIVVPDSSSEAAADEADSESDDAS